MHDHGRVDRGTHAAHKKGRKRKSLHANGTRRSTSAKHVRGKYETYDPMPYPILIYTASEKVSRDLMRIDKEYVSFVGIHFR